MHIIQYHILHLLQRLLYCPVIIDHVIKLIINNRIPLRYFGLFIISKVKEHLGLNT